MEDPHIYNPSPRRPGTRASKFELKHISTSTIPPADLSQPSSATAESSQPLTSTRISSLAGSAVGGTGSPHKSRSVLNLTSSTLFGIYSPNGYETPSASSFRTVVDTPDGVNTPWGTGAQTPLRSTSDVDEQEPAAVTERLRVRAGKSSELLDTETMHTTTDSELHARRRRRLSRARSHSGAVPSQSRSRTLFRAAARSAVLFLIGVLYGGIVTQLHASQSLAPVEVRNFDRVGWAYLCFWGFSGLVLGNALPLLDRSWGKNTATVRKTVGTAPDKHETRAKNDSSEHSVPQQLDWNPIVRSIGAFVGIAFAIRRLPWQTPLQLSLTLALANPMFWYLLDRSRAGFVLSTTFALLGATALISINPGMLPSPITFGEAPLASLQNFVAPSANGSSPGETKGADGDLGEVGIFQSVAVATWIASVMFCSCVCFGNIGRRLAIAGRSEGQGNGEHSDAAEATTVVD